ncbi:acyl carrier protein [Weissella viridescens]|jgi:acyl carrier protein|uniref:acyl carrier protein n=1 Tax=Weissella viridescens TaxID=1629 RepID=UPI00092E28D2|nr:acyl carrier protein [Weissella viridescens]MBX4172643.1 acyl carrier protein [Weissella viridescens]MCB6840440.1 acyl carrier protein [Weissella viridescens]MCB6847173.1 acyl carrier protein [Weissella viridescens]QOD86598.1 acyl carrier protein [Weissella viridescens]WJI91731.1 acyl carrier protein [Weissella viridescens]
MTNEEIFNKVQAILMDQFDLDQDDVKLTTNFEDDIEADSLDLFEVLNNVEEEFDIELEVAEDIKTVQDLVNKIQAQIDAK